MRRPLVSLSLAVVLAAVLAEPAAAACPRLPAQSGTAVGVLERTSGGVTRTTVRVCTAGRRVTLARGELRGRSGLVVGAASAAGRRVAWIEARLQRRSRAIVLRVATLSRRGAVRRVRRVPVGRDRTPVRPELGIVLTDGGDLAWLVSTPGRGGRVVTWERGDRRRTVARPLASGLALEDGRTLRWTEGSGELGFYDLQHRPCPTRSRYESVQTGARVAITQATYGAMTVMRGCDLVTRRDRVIAQAAASDTLSVIGTDRTSVLFARESGPEPCATRVLRTIDVASGRRGTPSVLSTAECGGLGIPTPPRGAPLAITERGAAAWIEGGTRLLVAVRGDVRELDRAASIADLRAAGDAVAWTADGAPRSTVP